MLRFCTCARYTGVVTNIDHDHLDTYRQDIGRLRQAFVDFANRLPFYGTAVVNADDPYAKSLLPDIERPTLTYGFGADAGCRATRIRGVAPGASTFRASRVDGDDLLITLPMSGCYNVQNALAAIAVADAEGLADEAIVRGLAQYRGVARRFQIAECEVASKRVALVDDYGHHPTELRRVIAAMRQLWPRRRLVMVYQPHRYTRTRDLFDEFVAALSQVDVLVLCEVYAASETSIDGADGLSLTNAIRRYGAIEPLFAATPEQALDCLLATIADDDVVAIQGAGDVDRLGRRVEEQPMTLTVARATFAIGTILAAAYFANALAAIEVSDVRVEGQLSVAEGNQVRHAVADELAKPGLRTPTDVAAAVKALGWIREVRVRRHWPDALHVAVARETLAARWGEDAWLTTAGNVVPAADANADAPPVCRCFARREPTRRTPCACSTC